MYGSIAYKYRSLFSFLTLHTSVRSLCTGDQPVARPLPIKGNINTGFEPTIPVFKRAKTVHATVTSLNVITAVGTRKSNERYGKCIHNF
jgi:hypothetical protein